jgi:hypothetical protein
VLLIEEIIARGAAGWGENFECNRISFRLRDWQSEMQKQVLRLRLRMTSSRGDAQTARFNPVA